MVLNESQNNFSENFMKHSQEIFLTKKYFLF